MAILSCRKISRKLHLCSMKCAVWHSEISEQSDPINFPGQMNVIVTALLPPFQGPVTRSGGRQPWISISALHGHLQPSSDQHPSANRGLDGKAVIQSACDVPHFRPLKLHTFELTYIRRLFVQVYDVRTCAVLARVFSAQSAVPE